MKIKDRSKQTKNCTSQRESALQRVLKRLLTESSLRRNCFSTEASERTFVEESMEPKEKKCWMLCLNFQILKWSNATWTLNETQVKLNGELLFGRTTKSGHLRCHLALLSEGERERENSFILTNSYKSRPGWLQQIVANKAETVFLVCKIRSTASDLLQTRL